METSKLFTEEHLPQSKYRPSTDILIPGQKPKGYTENMTEITRPELDAKLELIEARLDARVQRIEASVDGFKTEAAALRTELSHAKWWSIGTAVAVLAVFLGTLQWGLSSQKEENARFNAYMREDVKAINESIKEIGKTVTEMRISIEKQGPSGGSSQ